jgi:subtilisin family serine protease
MVNGHWFKKGSRLFKITIFVMLVCFQVLGSTPQAAGKEEGKPALLFNATETGYTRIIVKLKVPGIEDLTAQSVQYKAILPGETFPAEGYDADLNLKAAIDAVADEVLLELNGKGYEVTRRYSVIPYLALAVSSGARGAVESLPQVEYVIESKGYIVTNQDILKEKEQAVSNPKSDTGSSLSEPKLNNTVNIVGASDAWTMGYTGNGYYVAVLDTGILNSHEFFSGKDIVEHCYTIESQCPNGLTEDDGPGSAAHHSPTYAAWQHGSVVTGIAAGENGYPPGFVDPIHGVARGSDIIAVQVCSHYASCLPFYAGPCVVENEEDVLSGLEYVYGLRGSYPIAAVNMSLGDMEQHGAACDTDPEWGIITAIVANLKAVGIATIAASGNDSYCNGINAPGCISDVVAVGGSTDADAEWSGSSWHATLQNLFAPANQVLSADAQYDTDYVGNWSGTSLAVPHVVGAFTLMKEACPEATVDEILAALEATGYPITPGGCGAQPSTPRIQIDDAIDFLPDSITITSPEGGEYFPRGYDVTIDWTTCGISGDVMIVAESNFTSFVIESSYPYDGAPYTWTIPGGFPFGACRVRVFQGGVNAYSDWFNVGKFEITRPRGGEVYCHNSDMVIEWNSEGISGDIMLVLQTYNGPGHIDPTPFGVSWLIDDQAPYNGSPYTWRIPEYITPDEYRVLIIKDHIMVYSEVITVVREGRIEVGAPRDGEAYRWGDIMRIDWHTEGIGGDVEILMIEAYPRQIPPITYTIERAYPHDQSPYDWRVPEFVPRMEYYIQVRQGGIKAKSGIFKIIQ